MICSIRRERLVIVIILLDVGGLVGALAEGGLRFREDIAMREIFFI
jgi:hypothetical protein